jgi:hypothetical protein
MLILFDDCIDFDGPTSNGWYLVSNVETDDNRDISEHEIFHCILSFLFRKFHTELTSSIDATSIHLCLYWALNRVDMKSVQLILDFYPKAVNYCGNRIYDLPAVHIVATNPRISVGILKLLLDKGADIHKVYLGETATSRSLWFFKLFFSWFERLRDIYQDLDEFMERETSSGSVLAQANWDYKRLRALATLEPNAILNDLRDHFPDVKCHSCWKTEDAGTREYVIEPWWEELKHGVRNEQCICPLLNGAESEFIANKIRKMNLNQTNEGSEFRAVELDSGDGIDSEDSLSEFDASDFTCQGDTPEILWRSFHLQGGRWNKQYLPNEYYCYECLELWEGQESGSDTEVSTCSSTKSEESVD